MTHTSALPASDGGPIAIICGGGSLPITVAAAVERSGRAVVLFPIRGWADAPQIGRYRHHWWTLARVGTFRRLARMEGCRDVVLIGNVVRLEIRDLRLDLLALRLLPKIVRFFRGGDDRLLSGIGDLLKDHGFRLVGAHEVAPEILVGEGPIGLTRPTERDNRDIEQGFQLIAAMGPFDVGQAVVVAGERVLAVEAAEGTDRVLDRIADLRSEGRIKTPDRVGVLVKAPKPMQNRRADLPTIGVKTIEKATRARLAGIAVAAHETLIVEPEQVAEAADRAGLFVVGRKLPGQNP